MSEEKYEIYCCEYPYKGSRWGLEIPATSFEDAAERLAHIGQYGEVLGVQMGVIPVNGATRPVMGWWVRLVCWWKNRRNAE